MNKFAQLTFVLILLTFSTNVLAQNITFESAKAKYDGHSYLAAAKDLQQLVKTKAFKKDAQAWNYLGLSYRGAGERKKSLKAFKKAVQLAPTDTVVRFNYAVLLSEANDPKALREIETVLTQDPNHAGAAYLRGLTYLRLRKYDKAMADSQKMIDSDPLKLPGYILASRVKETELNDRVIKNLSHPKDEIGLLKESVAIWESGIQRCGDCSVKEAFEYQLDIRQRFLKRIEREGMPKDDIPSSENSTAEDSGSLPNSGFKIVSKPRPSYTDKARVKSISGKVILVAAFGVTGEIECYLVLKPLGYGLDQKAINALQEIQFIPAVKDGKRISTIRSVEYTFTVY